MGNARNHLGNGKFSTYLYEAIPGTTEEIGGLKCEIIKLGADDDGRHSNIPMRSGTSDVYLCLGTDGKPKQLRLFKDHVAAVDYDWSHPHYNDPKKGGDGQRFPKGTVHVQPFSNDTRLSNIARLMTDSEIETTGKIIHHYNPNVKFTI